MRNLIITGSAKLKNSSFGYTVDGVESYFRNALAAQGWIVHNLDFTIQSYANFLDSPFFDLC